jgi:hypothetical protein
MDDLAAIRQGLLRLKSIIAAERFSRALYRHYLALKAGYREDQLRDELGRWADEGGGRSRVELAASERPPIGRLSRLKLAIEAAKKIIEAFRDKNYLWDFFKEPVGTISTTEIDGKQIVGTNSGSPVYSDVDYREAEELRDSLIAKYPKVMQSGNIGQKPNDALFHAEANVLLRAARESGGSCTVLPFVGLELGNPTVTFISPRGSSKTMRNGAWID